MHGLGSSQDTGRLELGGLGLGEQLLPVILPYRRSSHHSHQNLGVMQSDVGKMLVFESHGQERILEISLVQRVDFMKAQGQDL